MIETVDSLRLKTKTEFIQILRWEDDGGAMYDIDIPRPHVAKTNTPRSVGIADDILLYAELKNNQAKGKEK